MFIPRLRKITDVVAEMRKADPNTAISYYFLRCLVQDGKLTALKYGDAWLINLDELYGLFVKNGGEKCEE